MKIRTDFVTNSSSSSFVVEIDLYLNNKKRIHFGGESVHEDGTALGWFSGTAEVTVSPRQLGKADSVEELIYLLKNNVLSYPDESFLWDSGIYDKLQKYTIQRYEKEKNKIRKKMQRRVLDDDSGFVKSIRENVSSMDDIESIVIHGERTTSDGDMWGFTVDYEYDLDTDTYVKYYYSDCIEPIEEDTVENDMISNSDPGRIVVEDSKYISKKEQGDIPYDKFKGYEWIEDKTNKFVPSFFDIYGDGPCEEIDNGF